MLHLIKGNRKLGAGIWQWSIPAWETCPGRSAACSECYAMEGHYNRANVRAALARNLAFSRQPNFADAVRREIKYVRAAVVRVHVAGDFYSCEYAEKWRGIMRLLPSVRFFAYTRSWRVARIAPVLAKMARLGNVRLWYSCDDETGIPVGPELPRGVRLAYLQTRPIATWQGELSLIFRTDSQRETERKREGGAIVCPVENGITGHATDCTRCGICWK